ncbi:RNA polymerase sigma factor [Frondihabitans sucicola]|uniref:RNA polymerase sigma factor n=1 Tax=Frondihabitans sucicola TaxID=1268041 RepID=A0ABM8GKN0_9MICO|nr:sigma-70 family RNA polymerase sigma factor [Frondihabitans sucicola]BDZ48933.1 RNA polymerase sigma factor [Frondihabitans sucicola]
MVDDDATLLRALHDEHAAPLWRYVVGLTHDTALASDIVQETLLRAWKKPSVLDQREASARAWLFTVARNLVIDDRRSARHTHEFPTEILPEPEAADRADALLDAWSVSDALASLGPEHRAVIVHAYYGGRSVAEIARELDIPEGTVKSRMHYGLRALRLAMQERGITQ